MKQDGKGSVPQGLKNEMQLIIIIILNVPNLTSPKRVKYRTNSLTNAQHSDHRKTNKQN